MCGTRSSGRGLDARTEQRGQALRRGSGRPGPAGRVLGHLAPGPAHARQALQDGRLLQALQNARVPPSASARLVEIRSSGARLARGAATSLLLLVRRHRLELLPDMGSWFDELADRARGCAGSP